MSVSWLERLVARRTRGGNFMGGRLVVEEKHPAYGVLSCSTEHRRYFFFASAVAGTGTTDVQAANT